MASRKRPMVERRHQEVARRIGTAILKGEILTGESLGGEIEASEKIGVSRTAYREALKILAAKGLVESRPKSGTRVTARAHWSLLDPDILAWIFSSEPDPHFVRALFELRGIIEPAAAELAALRRSHEQLSQMERCLVAMAKLGLSDDKGQIADREFHRLIFEATGNVALQTLSNSVGAAVQWTTHFKQERSSNPRDSIADHQAVFDAIAIGSASDAREAMLELLNRALQDMGIWAGGDGLLQPGSC